MASWTADAVVAASILLAGISFSLATLGAIAWRRLRSPRLGFVALAFVGFAVEGIVLARDAYDARAALVAGEVAHPFLLPGLNLLTVLLLYVAVLKR